MNVFATSSDPVACARALDDKRVVKMCLETTQILSTVVGGPYKPSHTKHPATIWAQGYEASGWLMVHGFALCGEYQRRFGKTHACKEVLGVILLSRGWSGQPPADFVNCARREDMGLDFRHLPVHVAYRVYLRERWRRDKTPPKWTNREPPRWALGWNEGL